ncbi:MULTISPECIES: hypothetical protein [Stappiaceae]|uniref:hypothetical protein n=1 Tax=Stappiaceae TaxID=2821832 RepID=UPI00129BF592|nr:hypothetical protein [Labrenzia sp. CE80]
MASWRPALREPDPMRAAIYDYIRNRSPQVYLEGGGAARALGRTSVVMSDGGPLNLDLTLTPLDTSMVGTRTAIVFGISGHVADKTAGYEVQGKVVLDRQTLAFLSIDASPTLLNHRG